MAVIYKNSGNIP